MLDAVTPRELVIGESEVRAPTFFYLAFDLELAGSLVGEH